MLLKRVLLAKRICMYNLVLSAFLSRIGMEGTPRALLDVFMRVLCFAAKTCFAAGSEHFFCCFAAKTLRRPLPRLRTFGFGQQAIAAVVPPGCIGFNCFAPWQGLVVKDGQNRRLRNNVKFKTEC